MSNDYGELGALKKKQVRDKKKSPVEQLKPDKLAPQFNSTGTILLNSTLSAPNVGDLLEACAEYVKKIMEPFETPEQLKLRKEIREKYAIFDEVRHPITKISLDDDIEPSLDQVRRHFTAIYRVAELAPEALIMGMTYFKKLVNQGLMVASKVWEELAVWLVDFVQVFPSLGVQDLSNLERETLGFLHFDVTLTGKDYAETYFELRAQSSSVEKTFSSCKPLDRQGEEKLEFCTKKYHNHLEKRSDNSKFMSYDANSTGHSNSRTIIN